MEQGHSPQIPTEIVVPPLQDTDIIIDSTLLRVAVRQRRRSWIVVGPVIFLIVAGLMLFVMAQSYTASASVSVQQSSSSSSPLAFLTGTTPPKKYIGFLHSRKLAEAVEHKFHLQQFYHFHTERRAIDLLVDSVKPEDSTGEGLLFIRVTLNGPPRLMPDPNHRTEKVKQMAADIANEYVAQLDSYYTTSDNDHDTVLLNAADQELQRARAEYYQASDKVRAFVVGMRRDPSFTGPLPSSSSGANESSASAPAGMQSLYEEAERTEAEIAGAEAAQRAQAAGTQRQLNGLAKIPLDDPLLFIARDNLSRAQNLLKSLSVSQQLSDDNPRVVTARDRVRIAQEDLDKQEEGYRNGLTTQGVNAETKLQSLRAKRDSILASLRKAEGRTPSRRERSFEMLELEKEEEIKLKALETTEEETAKLRLSAVPGHSRVSLVDAAIIPDAGQPRVAIILLLALGAAILPFFPVVAWDYMRLARQQHTPVVPLTDIDMSQGVVTQTDEADILPRNGKNNL